MTRTFITSAEQDAAIAWRVALLQQQDPSMTEDKLIASFAVEKLRDAVKEYRDSEGARVFEAYKTATVEQQTAAKAALGL